MLSRCSRFDLSRVKTHDTLFVYLKKIKALENGNISDDALKLICKCSEGKREGCPIFIGQGSFKQFGK